MSAFFEYRNFEDNSIRHRYLCCNKNCKKKFDENLKKRLFKTNNFSNYDINKFILLLQKGIDPHEYMDD